MLFSFHGLDSKCITRFQVTVSPARIYSMKQLFVFSVVRGIMPPLQPNTSGYCCVIGSSYLLAISISRPSIFGALGELNLYHDERVLRLG